MADRRRSVFDRLLRRTAAGGGELLTGPIRGALLGSEHLAQRARAIAVEQRIWPSRTAKPRVSLLLARLDESRKVLSDVHSKLVEAAERGSDVGPAGEWLLDNNHVVQEHTREVRLNLPPSYYNELPTLQHGPLSGYPRIYDLCITLISHSEGRIDRENIELCFGAFQEVEALTLGELWAMPAMLRLSLIENIRRMALRTLKRIEERELADQWAARIEAADSEGAAELGSLLDEFTTSHPPLSPTFVSRFLHQLHSIQGQYQPLVRLEQWIALESFSSKTAADLATEHLAHTQIMIANSITSLRTLAHIDWRTVVESLCVIDTMLREDPAGYYHRMDFETRDRYRHAIESIARRTKLSEAAVARRVVELARSAAGDAALGSDTVEGGEGQSQPFEIPLRSHIGYYIEDHGRDDLERACGYNPKVGQAIFRLGMRHPNFVFVGGIVIGTAIGIAAAFGLVGPEARSAWAAVLPFVLLPAIDIAVNMINQLFTTFLPPRRLPMLDMSGPAGISEELRTAVVVPILIESVGAVEETLEHLEVQYLANRGNHLHFAILSDLVDAPQELEPGDPAIIEAAAEGIRALNARYTNGADDVFYLFHRPRRWNPQQGVWMGWERKRGKLSEFNRFLRGQKGAFSKIVGDVEPLRKVRYVITLDADTVLPPDAAQRLVGAMAHPLNRAVFDPARGRVIRGYGILQPRVGVSLPSAHRSRFAAIHSGQPGVDPYTTAVSDVYQDLYGEGSFTGKGIYDVDIFERATRGRFPPNTVLSHDLIEGSLARSGLVTEIQLYDDYPAHYLAFTRRKHRWIRGDWQLLDWLTPHISRPDSRERNILTILSRWKIFDNLRRSGTEIALLAFLVAGWTVLPGSPIRYTALALGAIAAPWIIAFLIAALRIPHSASLRAYYGSVLRDAVTSVKQFGLAVAFLPHQAWVSADAILRTLVRLFVTRRNLLEWQTAYLTERSISNNARANWRAMSPAVVFACVLLVLGCIDAFTRAVTADSLRFALAVVPIALLWAASPAIATGLSRPVENIEPEIPDGLRDQAMRYARLHWEFYERFVNAETSWLTPDNFQEDPTPVVAMRTSPTNIGLQLLATVSAFDLGFIEADEMVRRIELAFGSLERMRRFRGHWFNWYDLNTLDVMEPAYISTVDSGNLAGHLIALKQACLQIAGQTGSVEEVKGRLIELADRAHAFALGMDFAFLYDSKREIFAIGYQEREHRLDDSFYDLLASEARTASFIAIAKNDAPVEHWFRLGRTLTRSGPDTVLLSWTGSMFEYLMPSLIMRSYPLTLLDQTCKSAVRRHIAYGAERGVPWGISESAYNLRDRHFIYQYRAFGVPTLALKRDLYRDLVVAPYASALAVLVEPRRAMDNLGALEALGALGPYGFRDAIDYTRPEGEERMAIVCNYMAHHIGMGLVALTNSLMGSPWQERFHADPLVRSVELLLHERIPSKLVLQPVLAGKAVGAFSSSDIDLPAVREFDNPNTLYPHVALLGRKPYSVLISHSGSGSSRYEDLAVTRWWADGTTDATGQYCYVKNVTAGRAWSSAYQPTCVPADIYQATLATDRVTYSRVDGPIETHTEIAVLPEDAAEVRRVSVTNSGRSTCDLELTSYGEIVLTPPEVERSHPAFANLFVETEYHPWCTALTATRRPRSLSEPELWCVHVVDTGGWRIGEVSCETDRARFLGRGRTTRDPAALNMDGALSGTTGSVLDPIFALRVRLRLKPGETASVAFTTLVATTREQAFELADRYHDPHAAKRALDLAWTAQRVELRELGLTPADAAVCQELAGRLLYPRSANDALRASGEEMLANRGSQHVLWANGISGDWPILLATIDADDGLPTLRRIFTAHRYLRRRGMMVDLVVLNAKASDYSRALQDRIMEAWYASSDADLIDRPGGIFMRHADQLAADGLQMLRATARVHIPCDGRSLGKILETESRATDTENGVAYELGQMDLQGQSLGQGRGQGQGRGYGQGKGTEGDGTQPMDMGDARKASMEAMEAAVEAKGEKSQVPEPLLFDNGFGGLSSTGDYVIRVRGDDLPPAPWSNVIANPLGGFVVTERGAGFTWALSSYFFRLTPWHNDPVSDPTGDAIYLRDDESGDMWSATPAPVRRDIAYAVRHGAGSTVFEHEHNGLEVSLTLAMAENSPVKISVLQVKNTGARSRRLSVTSYAEWTLGVSREKAQHRVHTAYEGEFGAIFAWNSFNPELAGQVAFAAMSEPPTCHTADRREFLGRNGTLGDPSALRFPASSPGLAGSTGAGIDPCAALQCVIELAPGESRQVVVLLGAALGEVRARELVAAYRSPESASQAIADSVEAWRDRLSGIIVKTPEPAFDAMINRWSLYQALACRMWARSAIYQSSGAYGFRDQLQDVMAFVYAQPEITRAHILRAAEHQFVEGDVMHWWHEQSGTGVRTRFSDDLVWLPYVVDHYVRITGDESVLDEVVNFLNMPELKPGEHEVFGRPERSEQQASIYDHCLRALDRACTTGAHGLPLIGGGDWNDGMNRVGIGGQGESVWLAWFLTTTLRALAIHAERRGDEPVAKDLLARAEAYVTAVETHGWDGEWYRRAFYDDGTPLGSASSTECRIDSIAQSWSVISGAGDPDRRSRAMRSFEAHLVDEEAKLIALLTPPFDETPLDPGYIKGYLPGVRENGAQYTHAALWSVLATALQGDGDRAFELFQMLNPLTHARTREEVERYKVEPYVVAADVYTADGQLGRGGWTWYTGAASWMYRVGLEAILGFSKRGDTLVIEPCVPTGWQAITVEYRHGSAVYVIEVHEPARLGEAMRAARPSREAIGGAEQFTDGRERSGKGIEGRERQIEPKETQSLAVEIVVDGRILDTAVIPLVDDGERHMVVVRPIGGDGVM